MVFLDYITIAISGSATGSGSFVYTIPYTCMVGFLGGDFDRQGFVSLTKFNGTGSHVEKLSFVGGTSKSFGGGLSIAKSGDQVRIGSDEGSPTSGTLYIFRLPESP